MASNPSLKWAGQPVNPALTNRSARGKYYLIELADFLLTFDVILKVCKHFETEDRQGRINASGDLNSYLTYKMHSKRGTAPTGGESEEYIKCSPVKFEEHVGEFFEKVWILGAEKSTCDLIHHMFQLWDPLVVQHGIISKKMDTSQYHFGKKKNQII